MNRLVKIAFILGAVTATPVLAHADTTYDVLALSGNFGYLGDVGTLSIGSTGTLDAIDLSGFGIAFETAGIQPGSSSTTAFGLVSEYANIFDITGEFELEFNSVDGIPATNYYTVIDTDDSSVVDYGEYQLTANSPAATPEPSSLVLLGTGALGAFGVARRKFFNR